jgi:hypothetical protein
MTAIATAEEAAEDEAVAAAAAPATGGKAPAAGGDRRLLADNGKGDDESDEEPAKGDKGEKGEKKKVETPKQQQQQPKDGQGDAKKGGGSGDKGKGGGAQQPAKAPPAKKAAPAPPEVSDECRALLALAAPPELPSPYDKAGAAVRAAVAQLDRLQAATGLPVMERDARGVPTGVSLTGWSALAGIAALLVSVVGGALLAWRRYSGGGGNKYTLVMKSVAPPGH